MNRSHSSSSERERKNEPDRASMLTSDWHLTPQSTGNCGDCAGRTLSFLQSFWEFSPSLSVFFSWRADGVLWKVLGVVWNVLRGGKAWRLDSLTLFLVCFASFWRLLLEVSFQALESGSTCVIFLDYSEFFLFFFTLSALPTLPTEEKVF